MSNNKSSKEFPPEVTKATVEDVASSLVHMQANPPKQSSSTCVTKNNNQNMTKASGKGQDSDNNPEEATITKTKSSAKLVDVTESNASDPSNTYWNKTIQTSQFNDNETSQDEAVTTNLTQQYDNVLDGIMERMKVSTGQKNAETALWEQKFFC